jgi:hypothetical protein
MFFVSGLLRQTILRSASCALTLYLLSAGALAQTPDAPEPDADANVEYERTVSDALSEYEGGNWEEASALFWHAHQLNPSARTLRGLGLCAYEARRYADSIRFLTQAQVDTRRPLTSRQRAEIDATIERARLFVGSLRLVVEPSDATVTINGQAIQPDAEGKVVTDTGWLDVEVKAERYVALSRRIRMNAGEHQDFVARLDPAEPDAVAAMRTPPRTAAIAAPEPVSLPAEPAPAASPLRTWKWVAAGAAVAALGTGGTLLLVQKIQTPNYEAECVNNANPASSCERRQRWLGTTLWNGSIAAFSVGAGLSALSVVLFALDAKSANSEPATQAMACTSAGLTGVACQWHF